MVQLIDTEIFITIFILISWLIFMSFLLVYALIFRHISYEINKKQIFKFFLIFSIFGSMISSLFYLRLLRQDFIWDVPEFQEKIKNIICQIRPQDLVLIGFFGIILSIFWLLLLSKFYQVLKQSVEILFIYFYQFSKFRDLYAFILNIRGNYNFFLIRRVLLFTNNSMQ
jgi:hypothetical protein